MCRNVRPQLGLRGKEIRGDHRGCQRRDISIPEGGANSPFQSRECTFDGQEYPI